MNTIDASKEGGRLDLVVKSTRLDAANARDFKAECSEVLQPDVSMVTADLSAVEFIDSSGVGALLSIYRRLGPGGASVKLRHARPTVQSVIELLRLHRIFELEA
jgi:anti-anti-sigma factor